MPKITKKKFPATPRPNLPVLVGANLTRLREKAGLSQTDLAERLGGQQSTISGIERGHRNPSMHMVMEIAKALGVQPKELFREVKP